MGQAKKQGSFEEQTLRSMVVSILQKVKELNMTTKKMPKYDKKFYNLGRSVPSKDPSLFTNIYVGIRQTGDFVRSYEEHPNGSDDLVYELVFATVANPTKKYYHEYNLLIGPFKSVHAAECFKNVEGLNTVAQAEDYAERFNR